MSSHKVLTRTVSVSGTGRQAVTPDIVRVDLRVGHDSADVSGALTGAAAAVTAVTAAVRTAGVADRDIRTQGVSVAQRWNAQGQTDGFTASQQIGIIVRDPALVSDLLAASAQAGGNALLVDAVRLDVDDRAAALFSAREAAVAEARAKAEQLARLTGATLGAVVGIAEAGAAPVGLRMAKMESGMAGAADMGMPIETGDLEISAAVSVTWELDVQH